MTGYEQSPDYGGPGPTWTMALWKPLLILVIIAALFLAYRSYAEADYLTPEQYHAQFGSCACPGDRFDGGMLCGHLSAYCRCGGREPLCFVGDDDKAQRQRNRQSHCHGCLPYGQ